MRLALLLLVAPSLAACAAAETYTPPASPTVADAPNAILPSPAPPPSPADADLAAERARLERVRQQVLADFAKPAEAAAKTAPTPPPPPIEQRDPSPAPAPPATEDPFAVEHPPAPPAFPPSTTCNSGFAGAYTTTWGDALVEQHGCVVDVLYTGSVKGQMRCAARDDALDCAWRETDGSSGKAVFQRDQDGGWSGTWGGGANATEGGAWTFTRKGG